MNPTTHPFNNIDLGGVCLISDLHLSEHLPHTAAQFEHFCQTVVSQFDTLIILGDLFEYWLGDDASATSSAALLVIKNLNDLHKQGKKIGFIAGNRDFLIGHDFAQRAHMTLLPDPCVLEIHNTPTLISHGDLFCTDDKKYQRFRRFAHISWVQNLFLKTPIAWRSALARKLRAKSQKRGSLKTSTERQYLAQIQDVNVLSVERALAQYHCNLLIHGHTHQPSTHLTFDTTRLVLPDWRCETAPTTWGYVSWPTHTSKPKLCVYTDHERVYPVT